MSFYSVPNSAYRHMPAGSPGWQLAPVPGWGVNTDKAGSPIVGAGALGGGCGCGGTQSTLPRYRPLPLGADVGDNYRTMTTGHVALAAAGGILVGAIFVYAAVTAGYLKS